MATTCGYTITIYFREFNILYFWVPELVFELLNFKNFRDDIKLLGYRIPIIHRIMLYGIKTEPILL